LAVVSKFVENLMDRFDQLHNNVMQFREVSGTTALDIALLPEPFNLILQKLIRQGSMSIQEMAEEFQLTPDEAHHLGEDLIAKGYLRAGEREDGGTMYHVYFARMRKQNIPLDL